MLKPFEAILRKTNLQAITVYEGENKYPACDNNYKTANTGYHFWDIYKSYSGYENCIDTERGE